MTLFAMLVDSLARLELLETPVGFEFICDI